jgi:alpha-mannosidase
VVLRVYEASGRATAGVRIKFSAPIVSAHETSLIEEPTPKLNVQINTLAFNLGPYEIKTFSLALTPLHATGSKGAK